MISIRKAKIIWELDLKDFYGTSDQSQGLAHAMQLLHH